MMAFFVGLSLSFIGLKPTQAAEISLERTDYTAQRFPTGSTIADFNGDGVLDFAVTNNDSSSISIFLGNGDGSFDRVQDVQVGRGPQGISAADFNGDGITDLAVTNNQELPTGTVSILIGQGDGAFERTNDIRVGPNLAGIAVADFNGDKIQDLAVTSYDDRNVTILLGNGDGTFERLRSLEARREVYDVTVGDFNNDGIPDVVVVVSGTNPNPANLVYIFLGAGDGRFLTPEIVTVGLVPVSAAVGDFNGDGNQDIAVVNNLSNSLTILTGTGDGRFTTRTQGVGRVPRGVTTGDFNGDGIPDLAISEGADGTMSILLGRGDGTFEDRRIFTTGPQPWGIASADFDGGGLDDLVVANHESDTVSVFLHSAH